MPEKEDASFFVFFLFKRHKTLYNRYFFLLKKKFAPEINIFMLCVYVLVLLDTCFKNKKNNGYNKINVYDFFESKCIRLFLFKQKNK